VPTRHPIRALAPKGLAVNVRKNKLAALAGLTLSGALALSVCGGGGEAGSNDSGSDSGGAESGYAELTGNLAASGASSMQNAQTAWTESFMGLASAEGGDKIGRAHV